MPWSPVLMRSFSGPHLETITLGHPVLDEYLAFAGARLRLNSWLAVAFDLKVFFTVISKEPAAITTADVFAFIKAQRAPRLGPNVVRLEDGEAGLSARTIKRRLASVSGLYSYLVVRGDLGMSRCVTTRCSPTRSWTRRSPSGSNAARRWPSGWTWPSSARCTGSARTD